MAFFMRLLVLMSIADMNLACRTPANRRQDLSGAQTFGGPKPVPCIGDRKIDDGNGFGFDFDAKSADMGHAYWMSLFSAAAYLKVSDAKTLLKKTSTESANMQIKFLNRGRDPEKDDSANAFIINHPRGNLMVFRGTDSYEDLATDARTNKYEEAAYFSGTSYGMVEIHKGFWDVVDQQISGVMSEYLSWQSLATYSAGSDEAFEQISRTLRGITIRDSENGRLDAFGILKQFGIIKAKTLADENRILAAVEQWRVVERDELRKVAAEGVSADRTEFRKRKREIADPLYPYWTFRNYKPLWLLGHSLGGSMAYVMAYRFWRLGIPVAGILSVGAAAPGTGSFGQLMRDIIRTEGVTKTIMRFAYGHDGPAHLGGLFSLAHITPPIYIDASKNFHFPSETYPKSPEGMVYRYHKSKDSLDFYSGKNPLEMPETLDVDLMRSVADHNQYGYLKLIEEFTFGGSAAGCSEER